MAGGVPGASMSGATWDARAAAWEASVLLVPSLRFSWGMWGDRPSMWWRKMGSTQVSLLSSTPRQGGWVRQNLIITLLSDHWSQMPKRLPVDTVTQLREETLVNSDPVR